MTIRYIKSLVLLTFLLSYKTDNLYSVRLHEKDNNYFLDNTADLIAKTEV